jgi:hypothetical protein
MEKGPESAGRLQGFIHLPEGPRIECGPLNPRPVKMEANISHPTEGWLFTPFKESLCLRGLGQGFLHPFQVVHRTEMLCPLCAQGGVRRLLEKTQDAGKL